MKNKFLNAAFALKAVDETGVIEGYGSIFGNVDDYGDMVMPGAFAESLAAHKAAGTMPKMLWQHDPEHPIGVWDDIVEDGQGLRVRGRLLLNVSRAKEAYELLRGGALDGLSIGYRIVEADWSADNSRVNQLLKLKLFEISLVTFPANDAATISSVKNARPATQREFEARLREMGFTKSEAEIISSRGVKGVIGGLRDEPLSAPGADAEGLRDEVLTALKRNRDILVPSTHKEK